MPPNTGSGDPRPRGLTVQKLDNLVRSKLIARTGSATNEQQVQRALYQALDRPGSRMSREHLRERVLGHRLGIRLSDNDFDQYVAHLKRRQEQQQQPSAQTRDVPPPEAASAASASAPIPSRALIGNMLIDDYPSTQPEELEGQGEPEEGTIVPHDSKAAFAKPGLGGIGGYAGRQAHTGHKPWYSTASNRKNLVPKSHIVPRRAADKCDPLVRPLARMPQVPQMRRMPQTCRLREVIL